MAKRVKDRARLEPLKRGDGGHDSTGGVRWLLTYADMITLLLAFFVILYAISATSTRRFNEFAIGGETGLLHLPR